MDIEKDNEGYLVNTDDWTIDVAKELARLESISMSDDHWTVIDYIRDYYEFNQAVPELRKVLKFMKESLGEEKATRKYMYSLFPYGYGQQACKIAGMRKPLKLMLDV